MINMPPTFMSSERVMLLGTAQAGNFPGTRSDSSPPAAVKAEQIQRVLSWCTGDGHAADMLPNAHESRGNGLLITAHYTNHRCRVNFARKGIDCGHALPGRGSHKGFTENRFDRKSGTGPVSPDVRFIMIKSWNALQAVAQ
jgi:hypothetical protein